MLKQIANIPGGVCRFCDKGKWWVLFSFSFLYLLVTCAIASKKMLWNDELFTLYISRLSSLSDIFAVLSTGADQSPPSFYLLTHVVLKLLGESQLVIRLPEVLGVLLMSFCLFRFVSRRTTKLYGFAAMVFPLMTTAYEYAYEARPYGLVLGFSALALLCWQRATESPRRPWWLIGLAISGVAATSSHYYGAFLLIPLGVGEIVRSCVRKRVDFSIWIALGGIMVPLALFFPVIQEARNYSHHFWAHPEWYMIPGFYYTLLIPSVGPIVTTIIVSSLWPENKSTKNPFSFSGHLLFPWHEIAAAIGFAVLPVVAVVLGKLVIGAFTFRYALSGVIGLSILWAMAICRIDGMRATMGTCFALFGCIWFIVAAGLQYKHQAAITTNWSQTYQFLQSEADSTLPIVAADLGTYMTLAHYAPTAVSSRVLYLADIQASLRYLGHDTLDRGILDLKTWFPVMVEEYHAFLGSHDRFLIYTRVRGDRTWLRYNWGSPWDWIWLFYELPRASVTIDLVRRNEEGLLFLVTASGAQNR